MTDQVNQDAGNEGAQETPEARDARMAALYRSQLGEGHEGDDANVGDDKPQRPANLPEKFWDAEKGEPRLDALVKSYVELERAKAKPAEAAPEDDANLTDEQKTAKAEAEKEARATLGLPSIEEFSSLRDKLTAKMVAGEEFTDDDYKPWAKVGITREDVDTYKAGLEALGTLHKQAVFKEAGGEETYRAMIEWGRSTYSAEEIAAYDRDVHSNDPAVSQNAVRGLVARYQVANGRSGIDVTKNGAGASGEAYHSKAEMVADMRDPKYAKDSAFRAKVASKIAAARAAGIDLHS